MKQICINGVRISNFLVKSDKVTYPMLDTKYLTMLPFHTPCFMLLQRQSNNHYKLLKFIIKP